MGTAIPIWGNVAPKPVLFRLISGRSELLSGMDIIGKMDATLSSGRPQFEVGQSKWEMMTLSEKHRGVLPLSPTSRDYAKLNGYFGKLRGSEIDVLQPQGDFGGFINSESFTGEKETIAQ